MSANVGVSSPSANIGTNLVASVSLNGVNPAVSVETNGVDPSASVGVNDVNLKVSDVVGTASNIVQCATGVDAGNVLNSALYVSV